MIQRTKGVISSCGALVELLEAIEHFVNRLDIYTQIPPTPAVDDMVVKILVELLSMLALVTEELNQRRSSESVLAGVLSYLAPRSQISKEVFRGEGCRGGPPEA